MGKTYIRPCPVCHDQKAKIKIKEEGNKRTGIKEYWTHVGKGCRFEYGTS